MYHKYFSIPQFIAEAQENNGTSRNLASFETPKSGYMVSLDPEAETRVKSLDYETLVAFIEAHEAILLRGDKFVGAWFEPGTGTWFLDISTQVADKDRAVQLAKLYRQLAIWDVANRAVIATARTPIRQ